jgi:centrosomin
MNRSSYLPTPPFTPLTPSSLTENKSVRFSMLQSSSSSSSLKNEIEEKQKLEKDNFDLKMKIYYLEESLRQQSSSGESNQELEDLRSENRQLRNKVQENAVDLEHRNTLLVKAKGAIEALKQEMERIRGQLDEKIQKEHHLHHQLQSVSQDRDSQDENLLNRIESLESENRHLTHTLQEKSEALHSCRVKLVSISPSPCLCLC